MLTQVDRNDMVEIMEEETKHYMKNSLVWWTHPWLIKEEKEL